MLGRIFVGGAVIILILIAVILGGCGPSMEAHEKEMEYRSKGGERINESQKNVTPLYEEMK